MKRIKTAHIVHSFLPVTQNWIYNQISFNSEVNHIVLCQFMQNREHFPLRNIHAILAEKAIAGKLYLQALRLMPRLCERRFRKIINKENPDVLHGHFSTESWRVLRVAEREGIPLVTTFYGLDINKLPGRSVWKRRYRELFKKGSLFIVEGKHMAGRLEALGCDSGKIRVIKIGIDLDRIEKVVSANGAEASGPKKILFVGLEREKKGAVDAVTAFCMARNRHPDIELHLVGDGSFRKRVRDILISRKCIDGAVFHGNTSVETYLKLLAASHIVLSPSCTASDGDTEGGAPVVCIEAQAAGKPVVGTLHCDIPEVVIDGKSGLLCPEHDTDTLASNLICLLDNDKMRLKMGEEGRKNARENHDIRKQVKLINDAYLSAVSFPD